MTTLLSEDQNADQQFEMLVCLQFRNEGSSEAASRLRSSAAALVEDVLLSKLNVEADVHAPELVHVRGFCDIESALVACRALQVAFEGFCHVTPQGAGVSVVLDATPVDALLAGQNPSISQRELLGTARPFQVLVTQSFYEKLQRRQPAALRSFRRQGGVCEFLWTGDQRLTELQGRNELMRTVVIPAAHPTITGDINDRTMLMSVDESFQDDIQPPAFGGLASKAENQARRGRRRGWIVMSCAAALLAILSYLGLAYTVPGNQLKQQVVVYLKGADAPAPLAAPRPPPPYPDVPSTAPLPPSRTGTGPKPPRSHPCEIGKTLVPEYLNLANNSLDKGEFQDAIRQYTKVLDCDAGNATARDGVQRARRAQAQEGKTESR
jgi:hypothetical protein